MNEDKAKSKRIIKKHIFVYSMLAFALIHFCIFYVYVNLNSFTLGFVDKHNIGSKGMLSGAGRGIKVSKDTDWRVTKGYFYSVPNGGGVNVAKGTLAKYKDMLIRDGIDINNIDLENEKVNQAASTLQYNALVTLTNTKLAMAKSVISGR